MIQVKGTRITINRRALETRLDKKERRVLFKVGAYGRTVVRRSMKRKRKPSTPPAPPAAKKGNLKKGIRFEVDTHQATVKISPLVYAKQPPGLLGDNSNLPDLLEAGGKIRQRAGRSTKIVEAVYRPRPYVTPALEKAFTQMEKLMQSVPL